MRSYQVFAALPPERARDVMRGLAEKQPSVWVQALAAASAAMNARPVYLKRQPPEKQADAVRRALSRVNADPVAAEVLAVYFLECRRPLLVEWLDLLGLEHEDGVLTADAPAEPPEADLRSAVERFLGADDDPDRGLLVAAFGAQDAIEWSALPALEALVPR
jgi:hypothetical protein